MSRERVEDEIEKIEDEIKRRMKVAEEKLWGAIIELIERVRMGPTAQSLFLRLLLLCKSIRDFQRAMIEKETNVDLSTTSAHPLVVERANSFIKTYNNIIKDLHSHFAKKDSYVVEFSPIEEPEWTTIGDVLITLSMLEENAIQIMSYLVRWIS